MLASASSSLSARPMLGKLLRKLGRRRRSETESVGRPSQLKKVASAPAEAKSPGKPKPQQSKPQTPPRQRKKPHWSPDQYVVPEEEGKTRFCDLGLPNVLLHAVADLGFQYCTPIQAEVLPKSLEGGDVAGQAQTGTGKTAAFLITTFAHLLRKQVDRKTSQPRALVIAPTRELAIQIEKDAHLLGTHASLKTVAVFGGMDYEKQRRRLEGAPVDVIAATPGRLLDFARRRVLDLSRVEVLIIDEADRMLDMGFIPDVKQIIRLLPKREQRRTMLFSATLSEDVLRLASRWMCDPVVVKIEPDQVAVDTVEQIVYSVTTREKLTVLYNLLQSENVKRVLIFANRRDRTQRLADELTRRGVECGLLSGAVDQKKRLRILEEFKTGVLNVVVATDVAGRGIHVDDISHVVNFELPYEAEDYVHRIGRTGRAGTSGIAVSFACEDEAFIVPEIEKYIGHELKCSMPPEELYADLPKATKPLPRRETGSEYRGGGRDGSQGRSRSQGGNRSGSRGRPSSSRSGSRPPRRSSGSGGTGGSRPR